MLEAALAYCSMGWPVLPLDGKLPRTKHGSKNATTDKDTVQLWFKQWPATNIGIATGPESGFFVIDIDSAENEPSILRNFPRTISVKTARGTHYYLAYPAGVNITNRTKIGGMPIDVRGIGGYVVAPPSLHSTGIQYEWLVEPWDCDLAVPTPELIAWVTSSDRANGKAAHARPIKGDLNFRVRKYLESCPPAIAGQSGHNIAFAVVCAVVNGFALDTETALDCLQSWNARCEPPWSEKELRHKIDDAIKYAHDKPRGYLLDAGPREFNGKINGHNTLNGEGLGSTAQSSAGSVASAPESYLSDLGNAKRMTADHGEIIRYCHPWNKWLLWDGTRWRPDDTGRATALATQTIMKLYATAEAELKLLAAEQSAEGKARLQNIKTLLAFALRSQQANRVAAMLTLTACEPGVPVLPSDLDVDPWLLNCINGTIDLRTGELRSHRRDDYLTKRSPVVFDPKATSPRWETFLHEIFGGSVSLISYMQRLIGYWLTGSVREHALPVLWGSGANGKSTLLSIVFDLLGEDYSGKGSRDLLMAVKGDRHPTALAWLHGKRFVAGIESGESAKLDEALVKELTGGDSITARRMREDFWTFNPSHKIALATNHRPVVNGTDLAIWRRLRLVPFNISIPEDKQDKNLAAKLREELPGILNWAIAGCLQWQETGLADPPEVRAATSDYRTEQDRLGEFIAGHCQLNREIRVKSADLFGAYKAWSESLGEKPMTVTAFTQKLKERGIERDHGRRWYIGITLVAEEGH